MDLIARASAFQSPTEKVMWTSLVSIFIVVLATRILPHFRLDIASFGHENLLETWRTGSQLDAFRHAHGGCGKDYIVYGCFEACYKDICRGIGVFSTLGEIMLCSSIQHSWSSRAARGADIRNIAAILGRTKMMREGTR